jgi:hypothetical protein
MRISWEVIERAAKLCNWEYERKPSTQSCKLIGITGYDETLYSKETAMVHCLTALLWRDHAPEEIRSGLGWEPPILRGQGVKMWAHDTDDCDASLAAVMSRVWPHSLLEKEE